MFRGKFWRLVVPVLLVFAVTLGSDNGWSAATPDYYNTPNWNYTPPIRKFIDTLPGLNFANRNNLNQYIPVAIPDNTTYPGSDYYEIELGQYTEQMHSDLPPTTIRGYRQTNTSDPNVSQFHYLGPLIIAQKDRPVRVKFTNSLPSGTGGNLFVPVDNTIMGSGPFEINYNPETKVSIPLVAGTFSQNRATLHLHGGLNPWISDGTPHQWIVPAGESTIYPKGASVGYVPDMWFDGSGNTIAACAGQTSCGVGGASNNPGPGMQTFYWTNQQSARLMFYHDHAWGITRLNVYVGEAAGYMITDQTEQDLIAANVIPADQIPLIIQDKTYVDNATIGTWDPTWEWGSTPPVAHTGDFWWPHVYLPAQNPYNPDLTGVNAVGRWHYGPWFYPPTTDIPFGPVPNPLYDPSCEPSLVVFCQPPENPGTPNPSWVGEAFLDTPVINGTAYPTVTLQPKTYRFRILNAAHDRFFNLQFYEADTSVPAGCPTCATDTEVKMVPALIYSSDPTWPPTWPADGRAGGVPDWNTAGPDWIQIGTEGGFLPEPVVLPNHPITWNTDPTTFNAGNVNGGTLILGPAERADVIVDFSQFAGKTLILYNDSPAPYPAIDPHYDFYTGSPDLTDIGAYWGTVVGKGPNTRTLMQIKVAAAPPAAPFDLVALQRAFESTPGTPGVFERGQNPILVGQGDYDSAYPTTFPVTWPNWGLSRISDVAISFKTPDGTVMKDIPMEKKSMHDEMGAVFDEYGRMSAKLGLELPFAAGGNPTFVMQNYVDPPTENFLSNQVQVWRITHNGVDTHPIHFHLYDVQVLNRVGWDGFIRLPDRNELGWKDTVRVSPLEDTIVAMRAHLPVLPFALPDSIRPLNPAVPFDSTIGFTNIDPYTGQVASPPVVNALYNYHHEYVWHCHILSHEEQDMMRTQTVTEPSAAPAVPTLQSATGSGTPISQVALSWTDTATETGYRVQRSANGGGFNTIATVYSNIRAYTDVALAPSTSYTYRIVAFNTAGDSTPSNVSGAVATGAFPDATGVTLTPSPASPQDVGTNVRWVGVATGGTGKYEYQFQYRPVGAPSFTLAQDFSTASNWTWYTPTMAGGNYEVQVNARTVGTAAVVSSTVPYSLTGAPLAPVSAVVYNPPPSPSSPQAPGASVLFTAVASGGSGTPEYQFWLHDGTSWSVAQAWSTTNTWTWNTTGLPIGTYSVQVWARNVGSVAAYEAFTPVAAYVLSNVIPVSTVDFNPPPSPASPQAPGASVLFTAAASGGSGTPEYEFWLHNGTSWSVAQAWGTTNTWTWNTTGLPIGTYMIQVWARNQGSGATYEAFTPVAVYVLQ